MAKTARECGKLSADDAHKYFMSGELIKATAQVSGLNCSSLSGVQDISVGVNECSMAEAFCERRFRTDIL